jgi:hypothetical protein
VKTYLDAPGYRIVAGSYTEAHFLSGEEVYVAARATDDPAALVLMHYASPVPCSVPNAARYEAFGPPGFEGLVLAYLEENVDRGRLHFVDGACRPLAAVVEDARLPVASGRDGRLVIESGNTLVSVDPFRNESLTLAEDVTQVFGLTSYGNAAVVAGGRLGILYYGDSTFVQWFGRRVSTAVNTLDGVFFEDYDGIHQITAIEIEDVTGITDRYLERGGCRLTLLPAPEPPGDHAPAEWLAYNSPCHTRGLVVFDPRTERSVIPTDHPLDSRFVKVVPAGDPTLSAAEPDVQDPLFVFYLAHPGEGGTGELHVLAPTGEDVVIGETSALSRALLARRTLGGEPGYDHGFALVDLENGVGRFVRWELDGSVLAVAEGVVDVDVLAPWPAILSDFDGTTGSLSQLAGGELRRLTSGVPLYGGAWPNFSEYTSKDALLYSDFDGTTGTLSLATAATGSDGGRDDFGEPLRVATPAATEVPAFRRSFLGNFPGYVYITAYDAATRTGRLEYQNTELLFTGTISEGASSLLDTGSSVLYTVPYGESAGVWITRKK